MDGGDDLDKFLSLMPLGLVDDLEHAFPESDFLSWRLGEQARSNTIQNVLWYCLHTKL